MAASIRPKSLGIFEYLARRRTPVRELQDDCVARFLPTMSGKVIELGALGQGRRKFAADSAKYVVSNVIGGAELSLDAAAMALDDNSVDGFLCESMLEHVREPHLVLSEIHRVLKPGGTLLLLTPWMYPFHAAPDDFLRFSEPALVDALKDFQIVHLEPLGNFWTTMATFVQLKVQPWRQMDKAERLARLVGGGPMLGFGFGCYVLSRLFNGRDEFAAMYAVVARKP